MRKNKKNIKVKTIIAKEEFNYHSENNRYILLMICGLLALSGVLVYPLFLDGFSRFIENIESAHIANAKYILENFGKNWNNTWYLGFPVHLTYPPLVPYFIVLISKIFSLEISHSYRIVTGLFVWLTPVSIFALGLYLTKRKTIAFLAGTMYLLLPNFAYVVIPQLRQTANLAGYPPYHWVIFAQYGEGPHLVSLFFLPLAVLFFVKSYRQPDIKNYVYCALLTALTLLSNLYGGLALMIIYTIIVISKLAIYFDGFSFVRLIILGVFSYFLTAFAFDISFIDSIFKSGYIHPENAIHLPPFLIIFLVILFLFVPAWLIFRGRVMGNEKYTKWVVTILWFVIFLTIGTVYYYTGYSLVPQPNRYMPETQIGFVLLLSMLIVYLVDQSVRDDNNPQRYLKKAAAFVITFIIIIALSYGYITKPYYLIQPSEMNKTNEYEIAQWMNENIDIKSGDRVYLTGTPAFWLSAFSNVPQVRGGADNAQPIPWWADGTYQINKGEDPELLKAWLHIFNVKYILVNYPESGTHYVDYDNFDRFNDFEFIKEFADGGYKVFQVPDANLSLFSLVNIGREPLAGRIEGKTDYAGIKKFASILNQADNSRIHDININPDYYKINISDLKNGESIIFKMNYDSRWSAYDENNQPIKIEPIGTNYIHIIPGREGDMTINLKCHMIWTEYLGGIVSIATLSLLVWMLIKRKKRFID